MSDTRSIQAVEERQVAEDLFHFDTFVVTIMCGNRWVYGAVSRQFETRYPGVVPPILGWGLSSSPVPLPDGKQVIFTGLWKSAEEGEGYPNHVIRSCTASAIRQAAETGCEELAMPLIGGGRKEKRKPAMGEGLLDALELMERRGLEPPEIYVVLGRKDRTS